MLMQSLLFVDPYGGLYRPGEAAHRVAHHLRPLHRITVFHPEVRYPKPATHWSVLPDELLEFFHLVFEQDRRESFPGHLLDNLRWTVCGTCGQEHARPRCPFCTQAIAAAIRETTVIRGRVTATRVFQTTGIILCAAFQAERLCYVFHEKAQIKREDGSVIASGDLDSRTQFRLRGDATLLGRQGQLAVLQPPAEAVLLSVDNRDNQAIFDANAEHIFWSHAGQLWRDGPLGPHYIGDVMANQTYLWCGPRFGFGFSQAGGVQVTFIFDANKGGINDAIQLPPLRGQLVDAACVFATERCWFFVMIQHAGRRIHRCFVIHRDGSLEASAQAEAGDGSWLGGGLHGHCASGTFLLAATDDGIVRVEMDGQRLMITQAFPDTEPFVNTASRLLAGPDGLYVVGAQEIVRLKIA
jgi:H/ACA ribonucleoprotein complex subunit 3